MSSVPLLNTTYNGKPGFSLSESTTIKLRQTIDTATKNPSDENIKQVAQLAKKVKEFVDPKKLGHYHYLALFELSLLKMQNKKNLDSPYLDLFKTMKGDSKDNGDALAKMAMLHFECHSKFPCRDCGYMQKALIFRNS